MPAPGKHGTDWPEDKPKTQAGLAVGRRCGLALAFNGTLHEVTDTIRLEPNVNASTGLFGSPFLPR